MSDAPAQPGEGKELRTPQRVARWCELVLLFAGLPLCVWLEPFWLPKIPLLLLFALACLLVLRRDPAFDRRRLWNTAALAGLWQVLLPRAAAVAAVTWGLVLWLVPGGLFAFPRRHPLFWLLVMALYPLLSAWPQELIYRTFFWHRYAPVLGTRRAVALASTLAFAFLHIIFGNPVAILLTLPGGWLFARTYERTESLAAVTVEHALYGCLLFTLGLGRFFYNGR